MSLNEFQSIERFGGKTIAESKAEISDSEDYILWTEDGTTQRGTEIHFQRIKGDFIQPSDETLIKTVAEQAYGNKFFVGNDGHALVEVKRWENPEGEIVGVEELFDRLLEVF